MTLRAKNRREPDCARTITMKAISSTIILPVAAEYGTLALMNHICHRG